MSLFRVLPSIYRRLAQVTVIQLNDVEIWKVCNKGQIQRLGSVKVRSVDPRWHCAIAFLQRSAGGLPLLSFLAWSIHLQRRGSPGGTFTLATGW